MLGGTGQIGTATARRLARDGWEVTLAARTDPPAELGDFGFVRVDRTKDGELESALGAGVDLLVDIIPFTIDDGSQLVSLAGRVGSVVAISSSSVYSDKDGHALDEASGEDDFPRLPVPIPERQLTVAPGTETYSQRKVAIERLLLGCPELRATVIRPAAIYGPRTKHSREWYFVKRALDARRTVVLARRGATRFQTTSVANLAELVALCARRPGTRVLNCGDPEPPTALEIGRLVAAQLGHGWNELLLATAELGTVGDNPWNAPLPFVLDMTEAVLQVGYVPVMTYARAIGETVAWLVEATRDQDWRTVLTNSPYLETMFDYAAEDEFLRSQA